MKKPKDISDYEQCVKIVGDSLYIFCVECDDWKLVDLQCRALVTYSQNRSRPSIDIGEKIDFSLVCRSCQADIGYLLTPLQKDQFVQKILGRYYDDDTGRA